MTFKVQIRTWWDNRLSQLESVVSAYKDGLPVRLEAGDGEETRLTDEQSKALLSDLTQLVEVLLTQDLPEFTDDQSDIGVAFDVYEWHQDLCGDLEERVEEMDSPLASSALAIVTDILALPFTLSESE